MQKFRAEIVVKVDFEAQDRSDAVAIADSWATGAVYFIGAGDKNAVKTKVKISS